MIEVNGSCYFRKRLSSRNRTASEKASAFSESILFGKADAPLLMHKSKVLHQRRRQAVCRLTPFLVIPSLRSSL